MYFRASDIIKFLDFETPVAPMAAMVVWLRQAERNGLVKRATDVCGYTIFKFRWFKKKKTIDFLTEKYMNYCKRESDENKKIKW